MKTEWRETLRERAHAEASGALFSRAALARPGSRRTSLLLVSRNFRHTCYPGYVWLIHYLHSYCNMTLTHFLARLCVSGNQKAKKTLRTLPIPNMPGPCAPACNGSLGSGFCSGHMTSHGSSCCLFVRSRLGWHVGSDYPETDSSEDRLYLQLKHAFLPKNLPRRALSMQGSFLF